MPFKSQAQERWMWATHPRMAARWEKETSKRKSLPVRKFDTPAWTRSEGKNPNGGLNAKGRASAKAQGHNLKPPVKRGNNPRRASFLARMGNMPGPEHKPNGEPTRLLLSLQAWGASSKADAKKKAAAMSSVSKGIPNWAMHEGKRVRVLHQHSKDQFAILHRQYGQHIVHRSRLTFLPDTPKPKPAGKQLTLDFGKALIPVKSVKPLASHAPNNLLKLKTTGRVSGHMNMTGIRMPKTPGTYVAKGYDFTMTQSRFGGASAVGKAFVEPVEKSVASLYGSGAGSAAKHVAQAVRSSEKDWDKAARADMRRRAERAMSGANGKDLVVRPSRGVRVEKPANNTRQAAPRSGRNTSTDLVVRPKGQLAQTAKPKPEYVKSTPLREVGGRKPVDLGMPGMRIPEAKAPKAKKSKAKVDFSTRSYAPEAAAAATIGGALGYEGYKTKVGKAVDEYGNQIPSKVDSSTTAMAGGAGIAALGAKKFGDARVAPVKTPAAATQAKRNAKFNAKRFADAQKELATARANKTRFSGGSAVKRAENTLRLAQNRADISASQAKNAKKAKKLIGVAQRDLRWKGAGLLAGGAGLAGMGAAMKEKKQ